MLANAVKMSKGKVLVKRFKQLIEEKCQDNLSVKDYAELLHVTPNYLSETVKSLTGRTSTDLINDRMLLEIRAVENNWYFDGYAASRGVKLALAKEDLVHPSGQWYHVAFVVTPTSLTTFVNGKQELHEAYTFNPIEKGQTSIGVRMNKVSWFKGAIYKIQISPTALKPNQFLRL